MAGRNVNVYTSNFQAVGLTPSQCQYEMDVTIQWTDDNGKQQETSEKAVWPDILDDLGADEVEDVMKDLLVKSLRNKAGVDAPTVTPE